MSQELKSGVVSNVRSTVASYIMYWHKLCLEISILISSGIVAVVTFGIDRASLALTGKLILATGTGLAVFAGTLLVLYAASLLQEFRGILVRADQHDALFENGAYIPGQSLYPKSWQTYDAVRMDIVPKWSIGLMISTWAFLSALIFLGK